MDLVKYIYHEKQEPGSQLCAQHCLNNLLQQPVYTEIDLAELASKLDQAEHAARHRQPDAKSYNFDDTGFFSISVLEKALQVWDLTLVRWRGEAMRQYQDHPEDQAGFILNLQNHWFTLRRFKFNSRWYNLNSFLPQPEWISPTYLQLVLAQAEAEGYSVFVIRKAGAGAGDNADIDPGEAAGWGDGGVADFPSSGADLMVEEMGHATGRMSGNIDRPSVDAGPSAKAGPSRHARAMEDEPAPSYSTGSGRRQRRQQDPTSEFVEEQDLLPGSGAKTPGSASRSKRKDKSKKRDELDEALERHAAEALGTQQTEREHWQLEQERRQSEFDQATPQAVRLQQQAQGFEDEELDDDDDDLYHDATAFEYPSEAPTDFKYHNRSYDDEDEALQAALKASMADLPPGFEMPELKPLQPAPIEKQSQPAPEKKTASATRAPEPRAESSRTTTERWRPAEPSQDALQDAPPDTVTEEDDEEPVQELTPAQIRQARLARFQQQEQEQQEARDRPAES